MSIPENSNPDDKAAQDAAAADAAADAAAEAAADYAAGNAAHYAAEAAPDDDDVPAGFAGDTKDAMIVQLEAEKANLTDRVVRIAADMENLRKRTQRETADARKYAVSKFAADMLGVSDNLQRAKEAAGQGEGALEAIVEGIDVTAREMARILEKHGVVKIPAEGAKFDPHLHQAMFEVPDESVPSGTVVQQVQEGYMIGGRVLRAALVSVSKGGPKPASAEAETGEPAALQPETAADDDDPQAA